MFVYLNAIYFFKYLLNICFFYPRIKKAIDIIRSGTHMTSFLREKVGGRGGEVRVGKAKLRCYRTQEGWGLVSALDVQSLCFY